MIPYIPIIDDIGFFGPMILIIVAVIMLSGTREVFECLFNFFIY